LRIAPKQAGVVHDNITVAKTTVHAIATKKSRDATVLIDLATVIFSYTTPACFGVFFDLLYLP